MTADVPRRAPLTEAGRQRTIATTVANGSQFGGTRMAKTVARRIPTSTPYTPPAAGGGGPVAQACYLDSNTYGTAGAAAFGGTGPETFGSYTTYFANSGGNISIITAGWYAYSCWAQVVGASSACFISASDGFTQPGWGYSPGGLGVDEFPTAVKVPFYVDSGSIPLPIAVTFGGGGTTFKNITLDLVAYG